MTGGAAAVRAALSVSLRIGGECHKGSRLTVANRDPPVVAQDEADRRRLGLFRRRAPDNVRAVM